MMSTCARWVETQLHHQTDRANVYNFPPAMLASHPPTFRAEQVRGFSMIVFSMIVLPVSRGWCHPVVKQRRPSNYVSTWLEEEAHKRRRHLAIGDEATSRKIHVRN